jgi:hypothetical protein
VNISAALCALVCASCDWKCPPALSPSPHHALFTPANDVQFLDYQSDQRPLFLCFTC